MVSCEACKANGEFFRNDGLHPRRWVYIRVQMYFTEHDLTPPIDIAKIEASQISIHVLPSIFIRGLTQA